MRMIVFILLAVLFLLTACSTIQEEELNDTDDNFYKSNIVFRLEHPKEVSFNEEFSIKVYVTNNLGFPITLSSIKFPFSDFKFVDGKFEIYPNVNIQSQEIEVLEYKIEKNAEANLGRGNSLIQFDVYIDDIKYGSRDLSISKNFVLEFV